MRPLVPIFCVLFLIASAINAQNVEERISVNIKDIPLELVLESISEKSSYEFSYNSEILPTGSLFSLSRTDILVKDLLDILLVGTGLEYTILGDQVILNSARGSFKSYSDKKSKIQLSGWVREGLSKEPIQGVNVFINGTTIGTTSDEYGNYEIPELKNGTHLLVFSSVGYLSATYPIQVSDSKVFRVNSLLLENVKELKAVEVVAKPIITENGKALFLEEFTKDFFGGSPNASQCYFKNPEVLEFTNNSNNDLVSAETKSTLIAVNQALGYQIAFELEYFKKDSGIVNFHAKARFENLSSKRNREKRKWRKNRRKSYEGSQLHFFRSLIADQTEEEGFEAVFPNIEKGKNTINLKQLTTQDSTGHIQLYSEHKFEIVFEHEKESQQYLSYLAEAAGTSDISSVPDFQVSSLEFLSPDGIKIDLSGRVINPKSLKVGGYWSWERVADLVPLDYDPKKDSF